jgi:hypothetical protein
VLAFNTVGEGTSARPSGTTTQPNPWTDITCDKCTTIQSGNANQPSDADDTGEGVAIAHLGSAGDDCFDIGEFVFLNYGALAQCFDGRLHRQHK